MFPQRLDSPLAYDIAKAMMDGFNRHYRLFRAESARAKHRFETADWHGQQRAQRERIEFYDLRVSEAVARLEKEFKAGEQPMDVWHQVKLHYIGLLVDHHQPELAESFFNSVTTKILHRAYFQNDFIFVRPAISTEYIEPRGAPTYRPYYPEPETLADTVEQMLDDFALLGSFANKRRDAERVAHVISNRFHQVKLRANFQLQVLSGLFFRNKGAYVVGKIMNGFVEIAVLAADPARQPRPLLHRRGAVRRRRPADAVQLRARVLHGRHGGAFGLGAVPALAHAAQAARRDLQRAGPGQAGQDAFLPRLPLAPELLERPLSASRPASRAWSCWCSTCRRSRSCSSSSRTSTRRRRTPRASRSRASTCS
jgi:hypothetical protein